MIRALDHFLLRVFFGARLANLIAEDHPLITAPYVALLLAAVIAPVFAV